MKNIFVMMFLILLVLVSSCSTTKQESGKMLILSSIKYQGSNIGEDWVIEFQCGSMRKELDLDLSIGNNSINAVLFVNYDCNSVFVSGYESDDWLSACKDPFSSNIPIPSGKVEVTEHYCFSFSWFVSTSSPPEKAHLTFYFEER